MARKNSPSGPALAFEPVACRRILHTLASVCLAVLLARASPAETQTFYLHDGDRVVFYGDSITEQGFYTSFLEDYVTTRFPLWNVSFINSGWSGDWVVGGAGGTAETRIRRDVLAHQPTVATFLLGTNDAGYQQFDTTLLDVFTNGYQKLLAQVQSAPTVPRITLLQPTVYDDVTNPAQFEGGYNAVLVRYGQFIRDLAQENNLPAVDLNEPVLSALQQAVKLDPKLAKAAIPDRIHPSSAAAFLMAAAILKAWNGSPFVTSVEIDAKKKKIVQAENTQVTVVRGRPLSWDQQDAALPLPLDLDDQVLQLLFRCSSLRQDVDRQPLSIRHLAAGRYSLKIDGQVVGVWTNTQLAQGIDLAVLPTPMVRQAIAVHELTQSIHDLRLARWQGVQVRLEEQHSPYIDNALNALDMYQNALCNERHATAQPQLHHYELAAVHEAVSHVPQRIPEFPGSALTAKRAPEEPTARARRSIP